MARKRMLSPEFFLDEDLAMVSPWARLLFAGLWCHADREGRLEDKPKRLAVQVFPYDRDVDVEGHLQELTEQEFIRRYSVDGGNYIQVIKFLKHQRPHPKEPPSSIPAEPLPTTADHGEPRQEMAAPLPATVQPAGVGVGVGVVSQSRNTESESFSASLPVSSETAVDQRESPEGPRDEYVRACFEAIADRNGTSAWPKHSTADFSEVCSWMDAGIPLRIALRGIQDCSKAPPNARYVGPAVREAYSQWRKAIA